MNKIKEALIFLILPLFVFACSSTKEIKKPPQFDFEEPILSKGIEDRGTTAIPSSPTSTFSTQDPKVIASLKLKNLLAGHTLRWDWHDPNGNLYSSTGNRPIWVSRGKYLRETTVWHSLSIKDEKAANYTGDWRVSIYLDKQFIASKVFEIGKKFYALSISSTPLGADTYLGEDYKGKTPIDIKVSEGLHALRIIKNGYETLGKNIKVYEDVDYSYNLRRKADEEKVAKIGKYYAVVIGIGKYRDDRIPNLKYTVADAEEIYNILTDPQYGDFPKDQVKLLIDEKATYNNIKSAVGTWLRRNARKDDTVIIFFAGHGAPEDDKTYWVTYNANIDDLYGTALSNDEIADMLSRVEAKKMIAFLDSCYSAATVQRTDKKRSIMIVKDPFEKFKGEGRVIITSSDGKEQSLELEKFGHGVFTYHLLNALKGESDENKDGFIELDEVWDYVKYRVRDTARKHGSTQTPVLNGSYSAGIVLSKHPKRIKELELEAEREKKEKELELKIAKLTGLYSKAEITSSQFDKAVKILESGEKNKLLDDFLVDKISLTTFKTVFK